MKRKKLIILNCEFAIFLACLMEYCEHKNFFNNYVVICLIFDDNYGDYSMHMIYILIVGAGNV